MPINRVVEGIEHRSSGPQALVGLLSDMLVDRDVAPGRRGLPQRNVSSSTPANMYLMNIDQVVTDYNKRSSRSTNSKRILTHDGWMSVGVREDEGRLRRLQVDLQEVARSHGLELHAAKTGIYEGTDLAEAALQTNHSAVEDGVIDLGLGGECDFSKKLVDVSLNDPESADRTSVHFACVRLRSMGRRRGVRSSPAEAQRMPHVADHSLWFTNDSASEVVRTFVPKICEV